MQLCNGPTQHAIKQHKQSARIRKGRRLSLFSWAAFGLTASCQSNIVHSLPGTNHHLAPGLSGDTMNRQSSLLRTAVSNTVAANDSNRGSVAFLSSAAEAQPDPGTAKTPRYFVPDVDSVSFTIDSATNRFIVNDSRLLRNFRAIKGQCKGINGSPTPIIGEGELNIPLQCDSGIVDTITVQNAVYIPSSPYNLVPPQLIVSALKASGRRVDWFKHNDLEYIFEYYGKGPDRRKRVITTQRSAISPFPHWIRYHLCRLPDHMGFQDAIPNCPIHD